MDEFEKWSLTSTEALTLRGAWEAGREAGMREAADICKRRADWILSRQDGQPHELSNVIVRHHASAHISANEEILSAIGGGK